MTEDRYSRVRGYIARGWPVFPLHTIRDGACTCPKRSRCPKAGKHPRTRNGLKDATTNAKMTFDWWGIAPDSNIGIRTGAASGLVVIDVDPRNGGNDGLRDAEKRLGRLPEGPVANTGGGGQHLLFGHQGQPIRCRTGMFRGVDIKGDGGYVVAPSSVHASGRGYSWRVAPSGELPELPPTWTEFLQDRRQTEVPPSCASVYTGDTEGLGGLGGVPPLPDAELIGRIIAQCLPTGFGQRHTLLIRLARTLKAVMPNATVAELKAIVRQWHALAKRFCKTKDWSTNWGEFIEIWDWVKYPKGSGQMVELVERAKLAIPICAHEYTDNASVMLLLSLCKQLQLVAGDREFFLSCRMAGELTGISHQYAARFLRMFVTDGHLKVVNAGDAHTHRASEYRYLGD